jgi:hypothetical protein
MNIKRRNSKKMRRMHGGATTEQIGAAAQMREVIKDHIFKNAGDVDNKFHLLRMHLNEIVHCGHDEVKKKKNQYYDNRKYIYDRVAEKQINKAMAKIMEAQAQTVIELLPGELAQLELAREKALQSNPNPGVPAPRSHSHSPPPPPQPQSMRGSDSPASSSRSRFSFSSGSGSGSLELSSRSGSRSPLPPPLSDSHSLAPPPLDLANFPALGIGQPSSQRASMSRSPPPPSH